MEDLLARSQDAAGACQAVARSPERSAATAGACPHRGASGRGAARPRPCSQSGARRARPRALTPQTSRIPWSAKGADCGRWRPFPPCGPPTRFTHPLVSEGRGPPSLAFLPPLWGKDRMGGRAMPTGLALLDLSRSQNAIGAQARGIAPRGSHFVSRLLAQGTRISAAWRDPPSYPSPTRGEGTQVPRVRRETARSSEMCECRRWAARGKGRKSHPSGARRLATFASPDEAFPGGRDSKTNCGEERRGKRWKLLDSLFVKFCKMHHFLIPITDLTRRTALRF
jgi:hypothetical protein